MDEKRELLEVEVAAGNAAADLLARVEPYFGRVETNLINLLVLADSNDPEHLQAIKKQMDGLAAIWKTIKNEVETGQMANTTLRAEYEH